MRLPPEEMARANVYGLLARLCQAPPDAALLEALAGADEVDAESRVIVDPWIELSYAAARTDEETVREEFERASGATRKAKPALQRMARACDSLRRRIATQEFDLGQQKRFFERSVVPAARMLGESFGGSSSGSFYRHVARFAAAFFRVERTAFRLLSNHDLQRSMHA